MEFAVSFNAEQEKNKIKKKHARLTRKKGPLNKGLKGTAELICETSNVLRFVLFY
jgi:hypothetical protein